MFNKIYLYSTFYIYIQQCAFSLDFNQNYFHSTKYLFNFNQNYFHSTKIFVQLQPNIISFNKYVCSTSTKNNFIQQQYLFNFNPNYFHSTKIITQLQPEIISFNNEVPGHSKYRHSTKFPVRSPVKYAILRIQSPDHMVHEIKMASEDGAGRDITEELTQIVRECVRNEIALQRSGSNTSLLMRTRDLIASSARSASREVTNSITPGIVPSFPATATPDPSSSLSSPQTRQMGKKRPAAATNHPWRLKGKQKKQMKQEFHPKAVYLLDKPDDQISLLILSD